MTVKEIVDDINLITSDINKELNKVIVDIETKYPKFEPKFQIKKSKKSGKYIIAVMFDSKGFVD